MEKERKQFSVADFVSNEKTPVETRCGYKVTIYNTNRDHKYYKVGGEIHTKREDAINTWASNGKYQKDKPKDDFDLFFSPKKTVRRMTNQELSWWLMEHKEEHREWKREFGTMTVSSTYTYFEDEAAEECDNAILIRSNGGEWREPLIENEEEER